MNPSDDRSQEPWTDPQTHLDNDPVNAEPTPDEDESTTDEAADADES